MWQKKDKIERVLEKSGHKAGSSQYIRNYLRAVNKVIGAMSVEKREEAKETAKEWNETHPPPEVQSQYVNCSDLMLGLTGFQCHTNKRQTICKRVCRGDVEAV